MGTIAEVTQQALKEESKIKLASVSEIQPKSRESFWYVI